MKKCFVSLTQYFRSSFGAVAIALLAIQAAQLASAAATPVYVFATFTGDSANDMRLRIYTSLDAINYSLYSDTGYGGPTGSLRDPSIMKHSDGRYYLVFTAPPYNKPYANQNFVGLAWSTDLQTWNTMPSVSTTNIPGVKLSWAPEWVVDGSGVPKFIVHCSSASSDLRPYLYTATNSDLTGWSGPVDIGIGSMHLDGQILKVGDTWHCLIKSNLLQHATAPSITGPWTWLPDRSDWANMEGPCAVQLADSSWVMYVDPMYDVAQYMTSSDLTNWSSLIYLPGMSIVKHGTVIRDDAFNLPPGGLQATPDNGSVDLQWNAFPGADSYNVKRSTDGGPYVLVTNVTSASFADSNLANGTTYSYVVSMNFGGTESLDSAPVSAVPAVNVVTLVHRYSFSGISGTSVADSVGGPAWDGTLPNGGTFGGGEVSLSSSSSQYVQLPSGILSNYTAVTIEAWVTFPSALPNNCFFFGFGNANGGSGSSYIFCQPKNGRIAITPTDYSAEQNTAPNPSGNWSGLNNLHVTAVFNPPLGRLALYTNGVLVAQNVAVTTPLSAVDNVFSYIGRSLYSGDSYFNFNVDEFRIYNGALSSSDIATTHALGPDQVLSFYAPADLIAAAGDSQVQLSWNASDGATGYNVKRSLVSGGPYTVIATNVAGLNYTDTSVSNGMRYYYVVSATNGISESADSMQASAMPNPPGVSPDGFLFVTFKNGASPLAEQVYFAISQDGKNWKALNDSSPVLASTVGEAGVRDHFILRSHDGSKFYLIATDLSIYNNGDWTRAVQAGSRCIVVWESTDLVHWSQPWLAEVAPGDAGCTWAPEAVYDDTTGDYLVFWAGTSASDGYSKQRIWACRTPDFRTFGAPFIYIERANHVIDADIVKDGDTYYRFTKDETTKAITMEQSDALMGTWTNVPGFSLASMQGYEGPECYQLSTGTWCLLADHYTAGTGYAPFVTTDLANGSFSAGTGFSFPFPFRHGAVLPITGEEYARLDAAFASSAVRLKAHWMFNETSGTNAADAAGNGWDGNLTGGAVFAPGIGGNAVSLDGASAQVNLPAGVAYSLADFTISTWVKLNSLSTWSRIFDFGTNSTRYMFLTPQAGGTGNVRFAITTSGSGGEQQINGTEPLPPNVWTHVAVTHQGNTGILYVNGVAVGTNSSLSAYPALLGVTPQNWIGRSQFGSDPYLDGLVDDFRIYSAALPAESIAALANTDYQQWKVASGLDRDVADNALAPDGMPVLLKYAYGYAPGAVATSSFALANNPSIGVTFPRLSPAPVHYTVQESTDLTNWSDIATLACGEDVWTGPATVVEDTGVTPRIVSVLDLSPFDEALPKFFRLVVQRPVP